MPMYMINIVNVNIIAIYTPIIIIIIILMVVAWSTLNNDT